MRLTDVPSFRFAKDGSQLLPNKPNKKDELTLVIFIWYTRQDSNLWPSAPQADALSS